MNVGKEPLKCIGGNGFLSTYSHTESAHKRYPSLWEPFVCGPLGRPGTPILKSRPAAGQNLNFLLARHFDVGGMDTFHTGHVNVKRSSLPNLEEVESHLKSSEVNF